MGSGDTRKEGMALHDLKNGLNYAQEGVMLGVYVEREVPIVEGGEEKKAQCGYHYRAWFVQPLCMDWYLQR